MERLGNTLDRFYKPLFIIFLVGVVILAYALGRHDAASAKAHGVTLSCDQNTLETLSMQPALSKALGTVSDSPEQTSTPAVAHNFVASKNGTKYYPASCSAANRIKVENQVWFSNEQDAQLQGYSRTTSC